MTVVKRCASLEDAYMIKNLLEIDGVEADILDEAIATLTPYMVMNSGIRVTVADEDAAAAREILGLPAEPEPPPRRNSGLPWMAVAMSLVAVVALFTYATQNHGAASGRKVDVDRNGDGKADVRTTFDEGQQPTLMLEDENFDGRWDVRTEYAGGERTKVSKDLDHDGTFDSVSDFEHGVQTSELVTPGGSGNPSYRRVFKNGIEVSRWEDRDRDGDWDTRIDFDTDGHGMKTTKFME